MPQERRRGPAHFTRSTCRGGNRLRPLVLVFSAALALSTVAPGSRALAQSAAVPAASAGIEGVVVDAGSGLPLAGATVAVVDRAARTTTDGAGRFHLDGLAAGVFRLRIERAGYQPALSDDLALVAGSASAVTLALQRAPSAQTLQVIGSTSTRAASSLQRASTISRTLTTEALALAGVDRAEEALRNLPAITTSVAGDGGSLGKYLPLQMRGLGALETTFAIDGHPVALGFPGGFNYQLTPIAAFRDVVVTYGSGSNLSGASAIGGVIDMRTLEPTADKRLGIMQGYGTFDRLSTTVHATGTQGRLGYAFAYGVSGFDGPFRHQRIYQPSASVDASSPDPAIRATGTYDADAGAVARSGLAKLRYELSDFDRVTFTTTLASFDNDKTGNGDTDYIDRVVALATGNQLLANYKPSSFPSLPACPAGTFVATNLNGKPNGFGPDGKPDGGITCQTPQQYATFHTGFAGTGPDSERLDLLDEHLAFEHVRGGRQFRVDAFTDKHLYTIDRTRALPFKLAPGDSSQSSLAQLSAGETGVTVSYDVSGRSNTVGAGATYLNVPYTLGLVFPRFRSFGAPTPHQEGAFVRDVYRAPGSPLTVLANVLLQGSTATHVTSLDPRVSVVYAPTPRDVVRFSAGGTTTQPSGDELGQPFLGVPLGQSGSGGGIVCRGLNTIGIAPSTVLHPERGVDQELTYGHGFGGDSQVQIALYNVNVYDKLYQALLPLSQAGTGFIDPAFLAQQTAAVAAVCGASAAPSLLGVSGNFNVGQLRARGFTLSGRQRIDRRTFVDYDWTLDSTALVSAPATLFQANLTLVPGSQLPHLPLHTLEAALDRLVGRVDVRYTLHAVSANNTKALPAYDFSDLRLSTAVGHDVLSVAVTNLFNQYADIRGLRGEGVPLALNAYAAPGAYVPYIGAAATERYALPFRRIQVNYELRLR